MPLVILSAVFASYWYAFGGARNMHPFDPHHPYWQTVVSAKKAELAAKIPQEWVLSQTVIDDARSRRSIAGGFLDSLLDSRNGDITTREPTEIVHDIASGNLSSVDAVTAFCKRAPYTHQIVRKRTGALLLKLISACLESRVSRDWIRPGSG